MKVTKFTYKNPDERGEVDFEAEVSVENGSDFDIELIRSSIIVVNANGTTVCGSSNDDDNEFISAKDTGEFAVGGWGVSANKDALGGSGKDAKAFISVTTYRREFVKIGTLDFPQKEGDVTEIKKTVSLGGVAEMIGVSCYRNKNNDEGECDIEIRAGMRNTSDNFIARGQVTLKLMDQRDAELESSVDYEAFPAKAGHVFQPSFWGLAPGKIKNASFTVTASVFVPVENYTAEATPTLSEDKW
jgi:hypothetical protein